MDKEEIGTKYTPDFKDLEKTNYLPARGPRDNVGSTPDNKSWKRSSSKVRASPAKPGSRREAVINVLLANGQPMRQKALREAMAIKGNHSGTFYGMYVDQLLVRKKCDDTGEWLYWPKGKLWPVDNQTNQQTTLAIHDAVFKAKLIREIAEWKHLNADTQRWLRRIAFDIEERK